MFTVRSEPSSSPTRVGAVGGMGGACADLQ